MLIENLQAQQAQRTQIPTSTWDTVPAQAAARRGAACTVEGFIVYHSSKKVRMS
jgi:hypothetical protein